jgi:hypothetical protein
VTKSAGSRKSAVAIGVVTFLTVAIAMLIIAYAKWFAATHVRNVALPMPPGAPQQRQQPAIVDRINMPIAPREQAPEGVATTPAMAAAAPEEVCRSFADRLPADYLVYGTGDPGSAGTAADAVDVDLDATAGKVVLLFGSEGPTFWHIRGPGARNVLAVVVSGHYRSEVRGLPGHVSVLHAAYDDHAPCGYFEINADQPQGANAFVSKLLVHAIDASFLPVGDHVVVGNALPALTALPATYAAAPSRDTPGELMPQIASATYASPRNGRSFDFTTQLRAQCQAGAAGCVVLCTNDLAGDPDFGYGKTCEIQYRCGENPAQTLLIPEGRRERFRCE